MNWQNQSLPVITRMPERHLRQPQSLDDMLLYAMWQLQVCAGRAVVRLCEEDFGITRREWRMLAQLALVEGSSPSQLAEHAALDRARTSRTLTALVRKGLIVRTPRPGDRREALLHLSDAGRTLYDALLPRVAQVNRALLGVLSDEETQVLDGLLARLHAQAVALSRQRPPGAP